MQRLTFEDRGNRAFNVLCLGAHCDDIEIGCGGLILRLVREIPQLCVRWVVFCSTEERKQEAEHCAGLFLGTTGEREVIIKGYRDGFLPYTAAAVKEFFEELKRGKSPDLVLTHYGDDAHQDHRLVSELTWNTWRDHFILEYEVPKYDGDLGRPNVFAPLSRTDCSSKSRFLSESYATQSSKHWFSEETFVALARVRGLECRAPEGLAEAFYARKVVI